MYPNIDEVKKILRSLLVATPRGLSVRDLDKVFREIEGRQIPFREFAFDTLTRFLYSMPETLRLTEQNGILFAIPVISSDINHIMKLVSEQSSGRSRSKRKPASIRRYSAPPPRFQTQNGRRPMHQQSNSFHRLNNYQPQPKPVHTSNSNPFIEPIANGNQHKGTSDPVKEDAKLFVPEMIEDDFDFETSSQTVITAIAAISPSSSERTIETNNDSQWPDVFEDTNRTPKPANLAQAAGVIGNKSYSDDVQSDEENDALPRMTRYEFMTLLDDGEYIANNKDPFMNLSVDECNTIREGSTIKIIVSEVNSPFKFWFQLQHATPELEELMDSLKFYDENFTNPDLVLPEHLMKPGQICVAMYHKQWHRARIVDVYEDETVKVFYIDYGTVEEIFVEDVRLMRKDFAELMPQAYRGCLDHIRPSAGLWSKEATIRFKKNVQDLKIYAKVTGVNTEEKTYYVTMIDTTKEVDVHINDLLIDDGHAIYEKLPVMKLRRRHYAEVHPTFDMLENGEYPSFAEICHFETQGYNFAFYEQSIITPRMLGYTTDI